VTVFESDPDSVLGLRFNVRFTPKSGHPGRQLMETLLKLRTNGRLSLIKA